MSLIPWTRPSPATERFSSLADLDEMLSTMFRGLPRMTGSGPELSWVPAIDVRDDDDVVVVTAELPGVKKEDVKIDVHGQQLTLRGEKRHSETKKSDNWWRRETSHGSFMRQITLPVDVDADRTQARMSDGMLEIHLPKIATAKTKAIKVT